MSADAPVLAVSPRMNKYLHIARCTLNVNPINSLPSSASFTFFLFYPSRTQMSDKGLWAETECARPAPACVHQTDCRQRENIAEAVDWAHWSQPTNRSHWKNKVLSITPPKSHISLCVSDTLEVVLLLYFSVAARSRILTHPNEFDRFCFKPQSLRASPCQRVLYVRLQLNVCRQYNPNYPSCCMFYKPCHPHINNSSILPPAPLEVQAPRRVSHESNRWPRKSVCCPYGHEMLILFLSF